MSEWKEFERAVADFVSALDKNTVVRHDVHRPDQDTGFNRQYDVWVDAKVCGIFNISVLISCKHKSRKLSVQDIDTFIGELHSTGANKGVLYSYSGFTQPAIEKAREGDIPLSLVSVRTCRASQTPNDFLLLLCKLFQDQPEQRGT